MHVRAFDACDVYVPSAQRFREALHSDTRDGLRRPGFTVGVAYADPPERVVALLETATRGTVDVLSDPMPFVTIKEFSAQYVEYAVFFWLDVARSKRAYAAIRNDVKARCWYTLREAQMIFSSDVTSGIGVSSAPEMHVELAMPMVDPQ